MDFLATTLQLLLYLNVLSLTIRTTEARFAPLPNIPFVSAYLTNGLRHEVG